MGGAEGNQTVLREHPWEIFPEKPMAFPMFVSLWGSKSKEDAAESLPEENPEGGF